MEITDFIVNPFQIKLIQSLKTASQTIDYRDGYIIKISCDEYTGYGESSPLYKFSSESLKEVSYALEAYRLAVSDIGRTSITELIELIPIHCGGVPSAEFGLETALLDLASKIDGVSLSKYLNPNALDTINSNGIIGFHSPKDKFSTMKVKIGYRNLFDEINLLENLTLDFGGNVKFRLDANGGLDLTKSIRLCKELEAFNIDYIEQPLPKGELEDLAELRNHTSIPIAVDESLSDFESAEKIIQKQSADVFVIKPMVTGSFSACKSIVDLVKSENKRSIITSSLEGPIGLLGCIHFTAALSINEACGLSTNCFYEKSKFQNFNNKNGIIEILPESGLGINFEFS